MYWKLGLGQTERSPDRSRTAHHLRPMIAASPTSFAVSRLMNATSVDRCLTQAGVPRSCLFTLLLHVSLDTGAEEGGDGTQNEGQDSDRPSKTPTGQCFDIFNFLFTFITP